MTKRTRLFIAAAAGILVLGLGTGLVASYMGIQNFTLIGSDGPAELAYVPADAHLVAYANVRHVMGSELRQKIARLQSGQADAQDKFLQETGINLERDVDQVVATLSAATSDAEARERPLLLARGRFDQVRIEGFVRDQGGAVEDYKGTRLVSHADRNFGVAFVEPDLVAVGTPASVRRAIDTKASGADVKGNAEVMALVRDIDDGNAWAVARFDRLTGTRLPPEVVNQLPPISWFAASGHIDGGLSGFIRAETRDEASAQNLREVLQGFMALARLQAGARPELNELMNSLQLGGDGKTVSLGFSVPPEMIDTLGAMHALRLEQRDSRPDAPARPARPRRPAQPTL
jgi:hypothetical protein